MAYEAKPLQINLGNTDADDAYGRTTIIYGESGVGKSTQLASAAEYLARKYGKPVRLISAEDSSKTIFLPLMKAGLVQALFLSKVETPCSALRKLSRGEWPSNSTGATVWKPWDKSACAYLMEGISSLAELMQEENRENGWFLGEQGSTKVISGGETLALPGQFSYNFVQLEIIKLVKSFAMISDIERVVWTAHEYKGKNDDGLPIQGPALVGTAKTNHMGKYCGMLLHYDFSKAGAKVERRIYLEQHPDTTIASITCKAKVTIPLEGKKRFYELLGVKDGYLVIDESLTKSIADVFRVEDEVLVELANKYAKLLDKVS